MMKKRSVLADAPLDARCIATTHTQLTHSSDPHDPKPNTNRGAPMGKGKKGVRKGHTRKPPTEAAASNKREERAAERQQQQAKKQRRGKRFGQAEEREYEAQLAAIGGTIQHMASDGNCLFRSIADQLEGACVRVCVCVWGVVSLNSLHPTPNTGCTGCPGKPESHMRYRGAILGYMESMPDDYAPYMEDGTSLLFYALSFVCACVSLHQVRSGGGALGASLPPSLHRWNTVAEQAMDAGPPLINQPINA